MRLLNNRSLYKIEHNFERGHQALRTTFCSKLLTLPDCPITPMGYPSFSFALAGRLPAVAADAPVTNVLNIAQTASG
jgi:hypothetical protein